MGNAIWYISNVLDQSPLSFLGASPIDPTCPDSIAIAKRYVWRIRKIVNQERASKYTREFYAQPDNVIIGKLANGSPLIDTVDERYKRFLPAIGKRLEFQYPCGFSLPKDARHNAIDVAVAGGHELRQDLDRMSYLLEIYMQTNSEFAAWVNFWTQLPIRFCLASEEY